MGCDRVNSVQIKRFSINEEIRHTVSAVHFYKIPLIIHLYAGWYGWIDPICKTGNLQESSAFLRVIPGSHFKSIPDLAACGLHNTPHVTVRKYGKCIIICNVSCLDIGPDSASVAKSYIGSQNHAVCIGSQISQIRLGVPDRPLSGCRIQSRQIIV